MAYSYHAMKGWGKKQLDYMIEQVSHSIRNARTPAEKKQAMHQMKMLYEARMNASDARNKWHPKMQAVFLAEAKDNKSPGARKNFSPYNSKIYSGKIKQPGDARRALQGP